MSTSEIATEEIFTTEPTEESEPEPESESRGWPEPGPEWTDAKDEWGPAWLCHTYIFGFTLLVLGLTALLCVIAIILKQKKRFRGHLSISLLTMIIMFCFLRFLCLIFDPYHAEKKFPTLAARLFWSLGHPFLLSAYSLVLLVLIDTTKMEMGPARFQNIRTILCFTGGHVVLVVSSDLAVYCAPKAKPMLVLCQCVFIVYGFLMCIGYLYVGIKIKNNVAASRTDDRQGVSRLVRICFVSSFIGLVVIGTNIYAASSIFGIYSDVKYVDSWAWWTLQTLMRSEEVAEVFIVLWVAGKSLSLEKLFCRFFTFMGCKDITRVKSVQIQPADTSFDNSNMSYQISYVSKDLV